MPRPGGAVGAPDVVAARCEQLGAGPRPRWVTGPPTTSNLLADSARMSRESSWGPTSAETVREIIQTVEELTRRWTLPLARTQAGVVGLAMSPCRRHCHVPAQ